MRGATIDPLYTMDTNGGLRTHAFRLRPGQDLRLEIDRFVAARGIRAGVVLACVGNLRSAVLRMADEHIVKTYTGTCEIVSLTGTVEAGNSHLHCAISDANGVVVGGHLKAGCIVGITAEVVIGELDGLSFHRVFDAETGFEELVVDRD